MPSNTRPDLRFGTQAALLFGAIVLALVVTLSVVIGQHVSTEVREHIDVELHAVANGAQRLLLDGLRERLALVERLAADPALWSGGLDDPRVVETLRQQQLVRDDMAWLGVADAHGVVRAATGGLLVGRDVVQRPWFGAGLRGPHVGDVHAALLLAKLLPRDRQGEPQRFVDFAAPIREGGAVVGVLGLHCGWDWTHRVIETLVEDDMTARGLELYIFDRTGTAIHVPHPADRDAIAVGTRIDALTRSASTASVVRWPDGDHLTSVVRLQAADEPADLGWLIVARMPKDAADAPVAAAVGYVVLAGLVVAMAAVLLAWLASRSISEPLTEIARAAVALRAGEPGARIPRVDGNVELRALSTALIGMTEDFEARVALRTRELETANVELATLARHDPLTKLLNRRGFEERLRDALAQARRRTTPLSVVVIDVDHFKQVNDRHGHDVGDAVLATLASVLRERFRETDVLARLGGEEFVALLPDTDVVGAQQAAHALVERVAATRFGAVDRVTVSCGVSYVPVAADGFDASLIDVIQRADRALYRAKSGGRNRAEVHASTVIA